MTKSARALAAVAAVALTALVSSCAAPAAPTPQWEGSTTALEGQVAPLPTGANVVTVTAPASGGGVLLGTYTGSTGSFPFTNASRVDPFGQTVYSVDSTLVSVRAATSTATADFFGGTVRILLSTTLAVRKLSTNGGADPFFGVLGTAVFTLPPPPVGFVPAGSEPQLDALAVDASGRLYALASQMYDKDPGYRVTTHQLWVTRFTPNGAVDTTWGVAGFANAGTRMQGTGTSNRPSDQLLVRTDGTVVVATQGGGVSVRAISSDGLTVVGGAYLPSGYLDPTRGPCPSIVGIEAPIGLLDTGGRILVTQDDLGGQCLPSDNRYAVAALDNSYRLDPTFGTNGVITTPPSARYGPVFQPDPTSLALPVLSVPTGSFGVLKLSLNGAPIGSGVTPSATGVDPWGFYLLREPYPLPQTPGGLSSVWSDTLYLAGNSFNPLVSPPAISTSPVVLKVRRSAL